MRRRVLPFIAWGAVTVLAAGAGVLGATRVIPADRDGTLIEEADGALANGSGPALFAGRILNGGDTVRRAVLRFDVGSGGVTPPTQRPTGVAIESVALVLTVTTEPPAARPREFRLHRLLADWGEGASATFGGNGVPAAPGDATWIHSFFPDVFWLHNGGQFDGEPSARLMVDGPGVYRFEGEGLLHDVKLWLQDPDRNFGWILIGDETERQTARAFASRENTDPSLRPVLEIRYRPTSLRSSALPAPRP